MKIGFATDEFSSKAARINPASEACGYALFLSRNLKVKSPQAYITLLFDVVSGDATLFMRADQVEASWSVIMPILNAWEKSKPADFPNYKSGSWGPKAAEVLIEKDGRSWIQPALKNVQENNESQGSTKLSRTQS